MSRHRFIKKLNVNEELEIDALSDGGEDDITPEQQAQLDSSLIHIRSVIGPLGESGLTDKEIMDVAWDFYFDLDKSVEWALEEISRRNLAKERKEDPVSKIKPPPSLHSLTALQRLSLANRGPSSLASIVAGPVSASEGQPQLSKLASLAASKIHVGPSPVAKSGMNLPSIRAVSSTSSVTKPATKPPSKLSLLAAQKKPASPVSPTTDFASSPRVSKLSAKAASVRAANSADKPLATISPVELPNPSLPFFNPPPPDSLFFAKAKAPSDFGALLISATASTPGPHLRHIMAPSRFRFDSPSPDDIVLQARKGTALAPRSPAASDAFTSPRPPAKAKEKSEKAAVKVRPGGTLDVSSRITQPTPKGSPKKRTPLQSAGPSGSSTPIITPGTSLHIMHLDMASMNLQSTENETEDPEPLPVPKMTQAREQVLEEARKSLVGADGKVGVSLVVIGHVDAGKSTLMGRLLYELGQIEERKRTANERASAKMGKSSFSWAWEMDSGVEERERGITIDIAQTSLPLPTRNLTILDAPGHKDFVPNMISGASQADCALLVVDASTGEFEAGFDRGGQTREHLVLVRSLGVQQVVVAINKLDMVNWSQARYEEIVSMLKPFLVQSGFQPSKTSFVPLAAMTGVNLVERTGETSLGLNQWYKGPTLVDQLDKLDPPNRMLDAPFRFPISNVFKGQTALSSGTGVSGRICSGVVQVGEKVRVLPGDETAIVRLIEVEDTTKPWAAAGSNVTLYLAAIDPVNLSIGTVLCPQNDLVPLASSFTARIIVFDIQVPITAGASVELFHHSRDLPATVSQLISTLDRLSGAVIKQNPRVLTRSASAVVQITLRSSTMSGQSTRVSSVPIEPFAKNKDMGRILLRRNGETIAAGIVLAITP